MTHRAADVVREVDDGHVLDQRVVTAAPDPLIDFSIHQ